MLVASGRGSRRARRSSRRCAAPGASAGRSRPRIVRPAPAGALASPLNRTRRRLRRPAPGRPARGPPPGRASASIPARRQAVRTSRAASRARRPPSGVGVLVRVTPITKSTGSPSLAMGLIAAMLHAPAPACAMHRAAGLRRVTSGRTDRLLIKPCDGGQAGRLPEPGRQVRLKARFADEAASRTFRVIPRSWRASLTAASRHRQRRRASLSRTSRTRHFRLAAATPADVLLTGRLGDTRVRRQNAKETRMSLIFAMLDALRTGWRAKIAWFAVSMAIVALVVLFG